MGSEWTSTSLAKCITIKHGFAFKGEFFTSEARRDILLTPGNFAIGGGFKWDKLKFYDGPTPEDYILDEGDLLVTMTDLSKQADTLGFPAIVPTRDKFRFLHNQRLGLVKTIPSPETDSGFLYYLFCTRDYRHHVVAGATGTTVKHTSPKRILEFEFLLPSLPEQKAIAHVLGSLDDKIELNRQMNATLEAMAQALFKSWFVDFDPVIDNALAAGNPIPDELQARAAARESLGDARKPLPEPLQNLFPASFTNTEELGWIPEGWEVGNLGTIAKQKRKGAKPEDIPAGTPYIGLQDMPQRSISLNSWGYGEEVTSGKSWFTKGDILFGKLRPYFHKVGIAPVDGVCSTDIVVVEPKAKEWFGYSLCVCSSKSFVDYTSAGSTGTKMPRTSWQDMAAYPLPIPTKNLAKVFNDLVNPSAKKIVFNILANRDLAKTRDTLLPKLLSGELRLPLDELEVAV